MDDLSAIKGSISEIKGKPNPSSPCRGSVREQLNFLQKHLASESVSVINYNLFLETSIALVHDVSFSPEDEDVSADGLNLLYRLLNYKIQPHVKPTLPDLIRLSSALSSYGTIDRLKANISLLKCINCLTKGIEVVTDEVRVSQASAETLKAIIKHLKLHLTDKGSNCSNSPSEDLLFGKLLVNILRCIQTILSTLKLKNEEATQLMGDLLGTLKVLSFYGLPGYSLSKVSLYPLYPSPLNQYVPSEGIASNAAKGKGAAKKRKKKGKKQEQEDEGVEDGAESDVLPIDSIENQQSSGPSDSEYSSTDYEAPVIDYQRAIRDVNNKVRMLSYNNLDMIIRNAEKRLVFGFWSSFIPDTSGPSTTQFNVLTTILKDPAPKIRMSALCFLRELLSSGKQFVLSLAADERKDHKPAAFTPLSVTLASMLSEVHRGFYLVLFAETNPDVLLQALKCICVLVTVTPYNRLNRGLLSSVLHKLDFLFNSNDINLQNSCLALCVVIFGLEPTPEELLEWTETNEGKKGIQRLLQFSFKNITSQESIVLLGESLKFLTTLLRSKKSVAQVPFQETMRLCIETASYEIALKNPVIQSQVSKFCLGMALALKENPDLLTNNSGNEEIAIWWQSMIKTSLLTKALQEESQEIQVSSRCLLIDFISSFNSDVYETFSASFRYHIIILMISKCGSLKSEPTSTPMTIKAAAIRCLGVYVSFPIMVEDISFIIDVAVSSRNLLNQVFDENISTQTKDVQLLVYQTTWTLGNLSDILNKFYADSDEISASLILELGQVLVKAFELPFGGVQGDNVKTNIVRAFSNMVQVMLSFNELERDALIVSGVHQLLNCLRKCRSFKLHWNVCHAFSSLLSKSNFVSVCSAEDKLIETVVEQLLSTLCSTRNHKVQSHAVEAICSIESRGQYMGVDFRTLFSSASVFVIENYLSVPFDLKNKWMDRMSVGINHILSLTSEEERKVPQVIESAQKLYVFIDSLPQLCAEIESVDLMKSKLLFSNKQSV